MSDPHDSNLRRAADFCRDLGRDLGRHASAEAISRAIGRIAELEAELAAERERRKAAEWVLKEIRIRLHAAGRRPEECWEMSEIDGHLAQFERHKD